MQPAIKNCAFPPIAKRILRAYPSVVRIAFKEWAIVVDALGSGRQILIQRKGGIREGRGGFGVEHQRFVLFPTQFHQQRDSVIPSAQERFDQIAPTLPGRDRVRVELFCEVAAWQRLDSLADAERLRGQHIWRDEVIAGRFDWGGEKNIHALAVRVFRLPQIVELPMQESYGGWRSWSQLEGEAAGTGARPGASGAAVSRNPPPFATRLSLPDAFTAR